jgi:hypothetical protein
VVEEGKKMVDLIHRAQIEPSRWQNTSIFRPDGKEEYRELAQYGNRHAVFVPSEEWGEVHEDRHNATDFPRGTLDHLALYANERIGVPEEIAKVTLVAVAVYAGYKILKFIGDNMDE